MLDGRSIEPEADLKAVFHDRVAVQVAIRHLRDGNAQLPFRESHLGCRRRSVRALGINEFGGDQHDEQE